MKTAKLSNLLITLGVLVALSGLVGAGLDIHRAQAAMAQEAQEQQALVQNLLSTQRAAGFVPAPSKATSSPPAEPSPDGESRIEGTVPASPTPAGAVDKTATPTTTPVPRQPEIPTRLVIPAIELDAPIVPAEVQSVRVYGQDYQQWLAPNRFAAGWHPDSARLGEAGNTVLNGHNNIWGEVFARLVDLNPGDEIWVYSEKSLFRYEVANKLILEERYQELDVRMDNAKWIMPSSDERLTLVTCWPRQSNSHRLFIVARPLGQKALEP